MSWSRRGVVTLGLLLPLGGCFRPMLAENTATAGLRGRIALPEVDNRFDYNMVGALRDRLGEPDDPRWRLDVRTSIRDDDLAITPDNAITRKNLIARAEFALRPVGDGEVALRDSVISQAGYNSTTSLYATRTIRRDTEDRLARDLGERIARRIFAAAERLSAA